MSQGLHDKTPQEIISFYGEEIQTNGGSTNVKVPVDGYYSIRPATWIQENTYLNNNKIGQLHIVNNPAEPPIFYLYCVAGDIFYIATDSFTTFPLPPPVPQGKYIRDNDNVPSLEPFYGECRIITDPYFPQLIRLAVPEKPGLYFHWSNTGKVDYKHATAEHVNQLLWVLHWHKPTNEPPSLGVIPSGTYEITIPPIIKIGDEAQQQNFGSPAKLNPHGGPPVPVFSSKGHSHDQILQVVHESSAKLTFEVKHVGGNKYTIYSKDIKKYVSGINDINQNPGFDSVIGLGILTEHHAEVCIDIADNHGVVLPPNFPHQIYTITVPNPTKPWPPPEGVLCWPAVIPFIFPPPPQNVTLELPHAHNQWRATWCFVPN